MGRVRSSVFLGLVLLAGCGNGRYMIQTGSFHLPANGAAEVARLTRAGLPARLAPNGNGVRVGVGDYADRAGAERDLQRLRKTGVIPAGLVVRSVGEIEARPAASSAEPSRAALPRAKLSAPVQGKTSSANRLAVRAANDRARGLNLAQTAERFVGIEYRWGGNNVVEGLDCSGFTTAVLKLGGVHIARTAAEQFAGGELVERAELLPGDLVFFGKDKITHVGIYTGANRFVHAPKRGESIKVSELAGSYGERYRGARRYW